MKWKYQPAELVLVDMEDDEDIICNSLTGAESGTGEEGELDWDD